MSLPRHDCRLPKPGAAVYLPLTEMNTVTLSPEFELVIPQAITKELNLAPGDKLRVLRHGDRLEFIPVRTMISMRGRLRGMDTGMEREMDRL